MVGNSHFLDFELNFEFLELAYKKNDEISITNDNIVVHSKFLQKQFPVQKLKFLIWQVNVRT